MSSEKPIKVIIAEDHQLYSDMLFNTLSDAGINCISQVSNGRYLMETMRAGQIPDIVLLDISMPEMDGNKALTALLKEFPQVKIIIISQYEDLFVINNYFERGVKAYIPKSQHLEQLVKAIFEVAKGDIYKGNISTENASSSAKRLPRFTNRELNTIKLIIDGKTNTEISDQLCVSIKTVELDRSKIYEKAEVRSLAEFIKFVNSSGWYYLEGNAKY